MERFEDASDFIQEDDSNSAIGPLDSFRVSAEVPGRPPKPSQLAVSKAQVPASVQQILEQRRRAENDVTLRDRANGSRLPSEAWTNTFHEFCYRAREVTERSRNPACRAGCVGQRGVLARTFFDLQAYDLDSLCEKRRLTPGSTQLMYMFYSRIYDKLVGKQRGVDVPLFGRLDGHDERLLSFCAILDWAHDFKLCPSRVGRRELERIYVEVHSGPPESPRRKFESKITYNEFLDLLALCGDAGEPMDRSKIDNSRVRNEDPRLDRVKRLSSFLNLGNVKKVKVALHNAYRDVHFWKLSDGADFEKEARAAEMRSRPQHRVEPVSSGRRLDPVRDAAAKRYLQQFTWVACDHIWEEFEAPYLDMGTFIVSGKMKKFKLVLQNCRLSLAKVRLEAEDCGPLRLFWRDTTLGPGQSLEIGVNVDPIECGEWHGRLIILTEWAGHAGCEETVVPTYSRVVPSQSCCAELDRELPHHAPRPFRPGSACRLALDPASITCKQMRAPTPGSSRPASASTVCTSAALHSPCGVMDALSRPPSASRPGSAFSGVGAGAPRPASTGPGRPHSRGRESSPWRQPSPSAPALRSGSAPLPSQNDRPLPPPLPGGAPAPGSVAKGQQRDTSAWHADSQGRRLRPKGAVPGGSEGRRQHATPPRHLRPQSAPSPSPPRARRGEDEDDDDNVGAMAFRDTAAGGGVAAVNAVRMRRPQSATIRRQSKPMPQ